MSLACCASTLAAGLAVLVLGVASPASDVLPRYDLRPGDRLVYRQRLERATKTPEVETLTRGEWTNHVLVVAERAGRFQVGFQRNRTAAALLEYKEGGKDRLERERPAFDERVARRPVAFAEANWLSSSGAPLLPWAAVRETPSEALLAFHELPALPASSLEVGTRWSGVETLGLSLAVTGTETLAGESCTRAEGRSKDPAMQIRYWFCPGSGTLARLEFDGTYPAPPNRTIHETLTFELVERLRGENVPSWLSQPESREGVLAAFMTSTTIPVPAETLTPPLDGDDAKIRRRVQALLVRLRAPLPTAERLGAERKLGQVPGTTARVTTSGRYAGRPYIVHVPDEYRGDEPFPLIFYLSGGPGLAITAALTAEETIAPTAYLAVYPQAEGPWWKEPARAAFGELMQEVLAELNVDTNRVFLTGFSNGGTGTTLYATLWPHRFAAAASLMGGGFPFFEEQEPLPPANAARLPFLLLHGDADPIIPASASRRTLEALRRANPDAPVTLEILKGRPHDLTFASDGARVLEFFKDPVRDPFPRRVSFATRSLSTARAFWVEILEKGNGLAEVTAEIEDAGTIRVTTRRVKRLRLLLRREIVPGPGPIRVELNGKPAFSGPLAEDPDLLESSARETADPYLAHSMAITLDVN